MCYFLKEFKLKYFLSLVLVTCFINVYSQQKSSSSIFSFEESIDLSFSSHTNIPKRDFLHDWDGDSLFLISSHISSINKNYELILITINVKNRNVNLDTIRLSEDTYKGLWKLGSIDLDDSLMVLNFSTAQFVFKKTILNGNHWDLIRKFDFSNIRNTYIINDTLEMVEYVNHSNKYKIKVTPVEISGSDEIESYFIQSNALEFAFLRPSNYYINDHGKRILADPVKYNIQSISSGELERLNSSKPKEWKDIDNKELAKNSRFKDLSDLTFHLRDIDKTISRVHRIFFPDSDIVWLEYHHPDDKYVFFLDCWQKVGESQWVQKISAFRLTFRGGMDNSTRLKQDNFPFNPVEFGNKMMIGKKYACLLSMENKSDFRGKTVEQYFNAPTNMRTLKLNVFKIDM